MMAMIREDLAALDIRHDVFFSERSLSQGDGGPDRAPPSRTCARAASSTRAACRRPKGQPDRGLGGPGADAVPRHRVRRRRRPAAAEVGRLLHLFRRRHRLSPLQVRARLRRHDRRLGRRSRRLRQAHAGGREGGDGREGRPRRQALPAGEASARRRAGEDVEARRRLRDPARGRRRGRPRRGPLHDDLSARTTRPSISTSPRWSSSRRTTRSSTCSTPTPAAPRCSGRPRRRFPDASFTPEALGEADLSVLRDEAELDVMRRLAQFPRVVEAAADGARAAPGRFLPL